MKRLLALFAGGLGLGALFRRRRRLAELDSGPSPAAELRARLAESKSADDPSAAAALLEAGSFEDAAGAGGAPGPEAADELKSKRKDVHDRARQALDELR